MSDGGPGRPDGWPWVGRHPAQWAVLALCVCQSVALCLLWNQSWNMQPAALPSWLPCAASVLAGAWAASQWPAWWRAAAYRFAGMAAGEGPAVRVRVRRPDGTQVEARVMDCWKLGDIVTLLAVSSRDGKVPRLLAVTGREAGPAQCRALHRAIRGGLGAERRAACRSR